jgi:hypothetical protein
LINAAVGGLITICPLICRIRRAGANQVPHLRRRAITAPHQTAPIIAGGYWRILLHRHCLLNSYDHASRDGALVVKAANAVGHSKFRRIFD